MQCDWDEIQNSSDSAITSVPDDSLLQATINDLIDRRLAAQQELDESEDDIKRVHADRRAAVAFLIPRRPSSIKKQEELEDERRSSHGIHLATSMIMNCPRGSIVSKGTLGRRFWVPTVMTEFRNLETRRSRLVFLESPDAASLENAVNSGRALTRLCQLDESVSNHVHRQFSNPNSTYSPQ